MVWQPLVSWYVHRPAHCSHGDLRPGACSIPVVRTTTCLPRPLGTFFRETEFVYCFLYRSDPHSVLQDGTAFKRGCNDSDDNDWVLWWWWWWWWHMKTYKFYTKYKLPTAEDTNFQVSQHWHTRMYCRQRIPKLLWYTHNWKNYKNNV